MRLMLLFVGLGVFFLLGWWVLGESFGDGWEVGAFVEILQRGRGWAWLVGIGLLVGDLFLPIPGTIVMSALGVVYGFWLGGFFAVVGSVCAGLAGYGLGRLCGEKVARRILGERDFEKGKVLFERRGAIGVAVSRALPIFPEVMACMAGLLRMPFGSFVGALFCGSLPMGFLFAWIGMLGREDPQWALIFSMAIPAVLWGLAVWWKRKRG